MLKKILIFLLIVLICIQFFHPQKNITMAAVSENNIYNIYPASENVKQILQVSCNDCHSNNTAYPWYSKIQPVDWWLTHHVNEGKHELNFDEFATYRLSRQYRKLDEIIKQVEENEMPLNSYTWMHKNAIINDNQKHSLISWAQDIRKQMEQKYPKDSLVRKRQ